MTKFNVGDRVRQARTIYKIVRGRLGVVDMVVPATDVRCAVYYVRFHGLKGRVFSFKDSELARA